MEGRRAAGRPGKTVLPVIAFTWREFKPEAKKLPPISHHLSNTRSRYFFHKSSSARSLIPTAIPLSSPSHSPIPPSPVKFSYMRSKPVVNRSGRSQRSNLPQDIQVSLSSTLHMSHLEVRRPEERKWAAGGSAHVEP